MQFTPAKLVPAKAGSRGRDDRKMIWIPDAVYPCGSRGKNDRKTVWIPDAVYPCGSRGRNDRKTIKIIHFIRDPSLRSG